MLKDCWLTKLGFRKIGLNLVWTMFTGVIPKVMVQSIQQFVKWLTCTVDGKPWTTTPAMETSHVLASQHTIQPFSLHSSIYISETTRTYIKFVWSRDGEKQINVAVIIICYFVYCVKFQHVFYEPWLKDWCLSHRLIVDAYISNTAVLSCIWYI